MQIPGVGYSTSKLLMTALLFFIVSHPMTYSLVQSVVGGLVRVAGPSGCPTTVGLIVHGLVFAFLAKKLL